MKFLFRTVGRLFAAQLISWAVSWTPRQDYKSFAAFHSLLEAILADQKADREQEGC